MTKRYKKGLVITLLIVGLLAGASKFLLFNYLMKFSPQQPNIATGQTYQQNSHGYYFYISKKQHVIQNILTYVFVIFAIGAGVLEYRWKTIRNIYDDLPKKLF